MRLFLKNLTIALGVLATILIALELPIFFNRMNPNSVHTDWYDLIDCKAESVFIGNSRAWTTIDPERFYQCTGHTMQIIAQDGWNSAILVEKTNYFRRVMKSEPKYVFIQLDPSMLFTRDNWYNKQHFLKYLLWDQVGIQSFASELQGYKWWEFYIPTTRYFTYPEQYFKEAFGLYTPLSEKFTNTRKINGYCAYQNTEEKLQRLPDKNIWENGFEEDAFKPILKIAQSFPESEIVFLFCPISEPLQAVTDFKQFDSFSKKYGIPLFDLSGRKGFVDELMFDHTHVNLSGSIIATETLCQKLENFTHN